MKTIIAGSRDIENELFLDRAIEECDWDITEVVSGGSAGVDLLGELWAKRNGVRLTVIPANWSKYGRAAGPIRNKEMALYADALIYVWDGESRGTKNMITEAGNLGRRIHGIIIPC